MKFTCEMSPENQQWKKVSQMGHAITDQEHVTDVFAYKLIRELEGSNA